MMSDSLILFLFKQVTLGIQLLLKRELLKIPFIVLAGTVVKTRQVFRFVWLMKVAAISKLDE